MSEENRTLSLPINILPINIIHADENVDVTIFYDNDNKEIFTIAKEFEKKYGRYAYDIESYIFEAINEYGGLKKRHTELMETLRGICDLKRVFLDVRAALAKAEGR